jgi:hypothetical protein
LSSISSQAQEAKTSGGHCECLRNKPRRLSSSTIAPHLRFISDRRSLAFQFPQAVRIACRHILRISMVHIIIGNEHIRDQNIQGERKTTSTVRQPSEKFIKHLAPVCFHFGIHFPHHPERQGPQEQQKFQHSYRELTEQPPSPPLSYTV